MFIKWKVPLHLPVFLRTCFPHPQESSMNPTTKKSSPYRHKYGSSTYPIFRHSLSSFSFSFLLSQFPFGLVVATPRLPSWRKTREATHTYWSQRGRCTLSLSQSPHFLLHLMALFSLSMSFFLSFSSPHLSFFSLLFSLISPLPSLPIHHSPSLYPLTFLISSPLISRFSSLPLIFPFSSLHSHF